MKKKSIAAGIIVGVIVFAIIIGTKINDARQEELARQNLLTWIHNIDPEKIDILTFWKTNPDDSYDRVPLELGEQLQDRFFELLQLISADEVSVGCDVNGAMLLDICIVTTDNEAWVFRYDGETNYLHGIPNELREGGLVREYSWEIRNDELNAFLNGILENSEEEGDNSLSQDKLDWFETAFFNLEESRISNMFLTSEYSTPADVNLGKLFYCGADGMGGNGEVPEEEENLVMNKFGLENLDVAKTTVADMNTVLQKYTGLTIETTNKIGLESLYYLEEKGAYYNVTGDTVYIKCDIVKGWTNEDGTITLQYRDTLSTMADTYEVTLKAVDEGYIFVSNKYVGK